MPRLEALPPSIGMGRAAQYLRMSRRHQQYSIANQSAAIALYAAAHNLGIVRSFVDEGKTGTTIKKREGLQELLCVVQSGTADFEHVLVYDVSRWGRFPDSDESAHYEYLCKLAGITVHYCAEQFENDNSTTSNLLKALKRAAAGEYSRELSAKVSAGQRRLVSLGFWQGGPAPFGMARQLVGQNGKPRRILNPGEYKRLNTERVVLTAGESRETEIIKFAFDLYTNQRKTRPQIVQILNERSVILGRLWTVEKLRRLFTNPVYKGDYAYGKNHTGNGVTKDLPKEKWLVCEHAFSGIISERQWTQANAQIHEEVKALVDSEMIDALRRLWQRKGKLSTNIVNAARDVPSARAYINHFGSMNEAYRLVGYPIPRDYSYPHSRNLAKRITHALCEEISERVHSLGGTAEHERHPSGRILLNRSLTARVAVCIGLRRRRWKMEWRLPLYPTIGTDIAIIARLCPPSESVLDYFVVPAFSGLRGCFHVHRDGIANFIDLYRFPGLNELIKTLGCLRI
jgi:DNA invertase Pin-like site-specific DNA recombinase